MNISYYDKWCICLDDTSIIATGCLVPLYTSMVIKKTSICLFIYITSSYLSIYITSSHYFSPSSWISLIFLVTYWCNWRARITLILFHATSTIITSRRGGWLHNITKNLEKKKKKLQKFSSDNCWSCIWSF